MSYARHDVRNTIKSIKINPLPVSTYGVTLEVAGFSCQQINQANIITPSAGRRDLFRHLDRVAVGAKKMGSIQHVYCPKIPFCITYLGVFCSPSKVLSNFEK